MKSILRATAILGSSSIVTIVVGLISAKAWAVLLGPSGLGFMGLLQSLVGLATLIAGMGVGTALVRMGANALGRSDLTEVAALRRAAWMLMVILGAVALVVLIVFRVQISQWMLGSASYADAVVLMGIAVVFTLAAAIQTGTLNAYHRVEALAKLAMFSSVIGTAAGLALVWLWREQAIALAVIASAATSFGVSRFFMTRRIQPVSSTPGVREILHSARRLLRFGMPFAASLMVGSGVQLILPAMILHSLGTESVGIYRAAMAVSINYLGFLLTAMGQDYYPRVSAVSDKPTEIVHLVNQQHRLVMLLGVPMILGVLALAPILVPLIYSPKFLPAVDVLEWQLIGDLFKFSSWTMGFVMLARNRSLLFFLAELSFGLTTLVTSWLGMHLFGLVGLGIGFLVTYVVLYLVNWVFVRRDIGLVWTAENKRLMAVGLLAAFVIRGLPFFGLEHLRMPVALVLALLAGAVSLYILRKDVSRERLVEPTVRTAKAEAR